MKDTIKICAGNTKMVAHRGVSGLERENTCAAFVAAGNRSYYGVETDVHRTADGNFIIIHDGNTQRVAGDNVNVEETSFDTLRAVRLRDKGSEEKRADLHLPSLEEYVSVCKRYEKDCVLELKSDFTEAEIAEIIRRIEGIGWLDRVIFIAFGYENLKKVRALRPGQPCQFLTDKNDDDLIALLKEDKVDLDIHYGALTKERVNAFHAAGIKINTWTVDDPEAAKRLIDWGVEYITSNILEGDVALS